MRTLSVIDRIGYTCVQKKLKRFLVKLVYFSLFSVMFLLVLLRVLLILFCVDVLYKIVQKLQTKVLLEVQVRWVQVKIRIKIT